MNPSSPRPTARSHRGAQRFSRVGTVWLPAALTAVAFLLLIVASARVGLPTWRAVDATMRLREIAAAGMQPGQGGEVATALAAIDNSLADAEAALRPIYPLLSALRGAPVWGATLASAPELMSAGRAYASLAAEAAPLMDSTPNGVTVLERLAAAADALTEDPARLARMSALAERAADSLGTVRTANLQPLLDAPVHDLTPLADALPHLLRAIPAIPTLLGLHEPHTYLVLVQNNHELRPTGGFITAVGRVTLDKGRITEMSFVDSYAVYKATTDYPPAPRPMQEFMQIPILTFRDANWSPDLATTAEIARTIYAMDSRRGFDDVITIDLNAVQLIIGALSPLNLPGIDTPVTGENILEIMKELWARPADSQVTAESDIGQWWRERKDFIPKLAQAVLGKVTSGEADLLALASAGVTALNRRDVQILSSSEAAAPLGDVFAELGWDGSLQPGDTGDFLALVDMNMGYNKADAVIDRSLAYSVTWPDGGGAPVATASVTYTHNFTGTPNLCAPEPKYGSEYDDMIERCYFDYVRLFVPADSELISVDGVAPDSASSQRSEKGTRTFAGYFSLEPGQRRVVTFRYRLPEGLTPENYTLRIQRQSGTDALPVRLQIGEQAHDALLVDGRLEWGKGGE